MMEAIVLAGGLGTRLRQAVPDLPKPMAPINGRPFLEYLLDYWVAQGVSRTILSVGYKAEVIREHFGDCYGGTEIDYAIEDVPLGTGGALLLAAVRLRQPGPVLVLNGDTFFEVRLSTMLRAHGEKSADVTMALQQRSHGGRYQRVELNDERVITSFQPTPNVTGACLVNGGVYLVETSALAVVGRRPGDTLSLEAELFPTLLQKGRRLCGYVSTGRFIDIGVPEDYAAVDALLTRS